jgi:hypothetical protein
MSDKPEEMVTPPQLVNGDDLIKELKMKPGREIGELLEAIREEQVTAHLATRDEVLAFVRGWLESKRHKT